MAVRNSLTMLENRSSSNRNSGLSMIEDIETRYQTNLNGRNCTSSF